MTIFPAACGFSSGTLILNRNPKKGGSASETQSFNFPLIHALPLNLCTNSCQTR